MLSTSGNSQIVIKGGPARSIQVDSTGDTDKTVASSVPEAFSVGSHFVYRYKHSGLPKPEGFSGVGARDPSSGGSGTGGCTGALCVGTTGILLTGIPVIEPRSLICQNGEPGGPALPNKTRATGYLVKVTVWA